RDDCGRIVSMHGPNRYRRRVMRISPRSLLVLAVGVALALMLDGTETPATVSGCGDATGAICAETESCSGMLVWRRCESGRAYLGGSDRDDASGGGGGNGF